MKLRNVTTALLVMLFLTGISFNTNAQEWRWRESYCKNHPMADEKYAKEYYYYRPWGLGIFNGGWRDYYYEHYYNDSEYQAYIEKYNSDLEKYYSGLDKEYDAFYKDLEEYHHHNYRDYDYDHYHRYYHHRYHDNYHPQVDDNK